MACFLRNINLMWDKRESNALAAVFCNATDRRMAPVGFRTSTACCPVKRAPDFHKPDTPKSTLLTLFSSYI